LEFGILGVRRFFLKYLGWTDSVKTPNTPQVGGGVGWGRSALGVWGLRVWRVLKILAGGSFLFFFLLLVNSGCLFVFISFGVWHWEFGVQSYTGISKLTPFPRAQHGY
jgi:hypothetical protein